MAEEAEQSREHTQGIQRHLHGSNEDGMLQGLVSISSLWGHCGVWFLSLVQFFAVAANFFSCNPNLSDDPRDEALVICP